MYRAGEEIINKGLSPFTRILFGFVSGMFGLVMIISAPPTDMAIRVYVFAGACLSISFACMFTGRVRQFFGSLIGLGLFSASMWYLLTQLLHGPLLSKRSEQSVLNAVLFLVFFGVPGVSYIQG
ncbi:hypothetical protein [Microbulbifer spongiae]|uniref:Uncharacterized protein n=1 Tax=Microbulbifer spongiae TaxID=2944933 RepID=A0ABY9EDZ3_9GAMM|nr:hypothetical protein [Microbulbifer sp. MI-G]WKD48966.1 hypothetical protein M8T91_13840 [Microbulbifer sp. MI-G]